MEYIVRLFYNSRNVGWSFFKDVYDSFGLECPSTGELKTPFSIDEKK